MKYIKEILISVLLFASIINTSIISLEIYSKTNYYFENLNNLKQTQTIEYKLKNHFIENKIKEETLNTYNQYKHQTIKKLNKYLKKYDFKIIKEKKEIKISNKDKIEEKEEKLLMIKKQIDEKAKRILIIFISTIILLLITLINKKNKILNNIIYLYAILLSIIMLIIGILLPIISIEVFKDLEFFEYTILKYDVKSITSSFKVLIEQSNYVIPVLLFLFSILIPIIKILIMILKVLIKQNNKLFEITEKLNKWSMADVFVVSIFISIFALNADKMTKANYEIGIYFYAGYVILSLIITEMLILNKKVSNEKK